MDNILQKDDSANKPNSKWQYLEFSQNDQLSLIRKLQQTKGKSIKPIYEHFFLLLNLST